MVPCLSWYSLHACCSPEVCQQLEIRAEFIQSLSHPLSLSLSLSPAKVRHVHTGQSVQPFLLCTLRHKQDCPNKKKLGFGGGGEGRTSTSVNNALSRGQTLFSSLNSFVSLHSFSFRSVFVFLSDFSPLITRSLPSPLSAFSLPPCPTPPPPSPSSVKRRALTPVLRRTWGYCQSGPGSNPGCSWQAEPAPPPRPPFSPDPAMPLCEWTDVTTTAVCVCVCLCLCISVCVCVCVCMSVCVIVCVSVWDVGYVCSVHCSWIRFWLPLLSSCEYFFLNNLYCPGLNTIFLLFCTARRALVYARGSRLISISLLLLLLLWMRSFSRENQLCLCSLLWKQQLCRKPAPGFASSSWVIVPLWVFWSFFCMQAVSLV